MKGRIFLVAVSAAVLSATPVWAGHLNRGVNGGGQTHAVANAKPAAAHSLTASLVVTLNNAGTSGACTGGTMGLANVCPSGNCTCFTYSGTSNGTAGKGTVKIFETYDDDTEISGLAGAQDNCASAYAEIDIAGKSDTEVLAFTGADCADISGNTYLAGGCDLESSGTFLAGAGPCSGTAVSDTQVKFQIKGKGLK
jgi:hypothetical protein